MRLALVYHQFIGEGGMERYLLALAARLRDRGHEVQLVTARTDGVAEALGVAIHRIDLRRGPGWRRLDRFAAAAASLALDADVVLGFGRTWRQDIHRAGGGCHALYSAILPWWKRLGPKNRSELQLERKLYTGGATRFFVVNASPIAAQLQRVYGVSADRLIVIHTPVDTDHFRPAESVEPRPRTGGPILLFASSHHRRKGLDTLIRALCRVPDAELWVAGAPVDRRFRRLAAAMGVSGRLRSMGNVNDLAPVYREADWFVHPTRYDACANTVLQSMASALPGIISAADGASEFIDDGRNGFLLVDSHDAAGLAAIIRRALALPDSDRRAMGLAARETVMPLTWDAHVEKWERLFSRAVAERTERLPGGAGVVLCPPACGRSEPTS